MAYRGRTGVGRWRTGGIIIGVGRGRTGGVHGWVEGVQGAYRGG